MGEQERLKLLSASTLQKYNEHTLVTPKAVEANIQASLERGWFANLGESMDDVGAIAWPVRVSGNAYAISIAGPLYRIEDNIEDKARSEEHTSELQSLMRNSYAVFCLKKKKKKRRNTNNIIEVKTVLDN